ncbi:glucokinase [Bradyrhizobium diazoefficiens]|uniref:Glucokinase n=1 Tax=Bradyrhizobium diazoefficiens TaxID=1355477 RepID=A0A810ANA3_9BRAD|nr:glucokinase [Bradyrhizobium diazoefficiens]BBZ95250.1 glucokinase [Bradyrhizobium diazoefficiens]BCA12933.1 glucokinase [Bradyrhizobium diazoefficiens]BCE57339.1 glucokinase [Bradyrhizobium diazoefficiens]BCE66014.1 glucokinase [Bradyrhizobium diazoefficiens]
MSIGKTGKILLADIGGTNARFALSQSEPGNGDQTGSIDYVKVADFPTVQEAIVDVLARRAGGEPPQRAVLAVAGPVTNNRCVITNSPWVIDGNELQPTLGFDSVHVLNDFEVVAWSLPALRSADLIPLGGQDGLPGEPLLVVGPGTGFGVSCLVERYGARLAVVTEAGHATLPAENEREERVIASLRRRFGHVSIERGALSGSGLQSLYEALAEIDGVQVPHRDAAAITKAALDGSCPVSRATLEMFCATLGSVAGNLAVTFGARGGVYIAGGIVPRFPEFLAASAFRARFEAKGRFQDYLRNIPTRLVTKPDASFVGLKMFADHNPD